MIIDKNDLTDIDECLSPDNNGCGINALCINTPGNYTCECKSGFVSNGTARHGECQGNNHFLPFYEDVEH